MYSPSGLAVKMPAMQEMQMSLGWEDPLEEDMATHSSILAWRIPWTGEPDGYSSPVGCKELDATSDRACRHTCLCKCHHRHLRNIFVSPKRNPIPSSYHTTPPFTSHPKQPLICLLSLLTLYSLGLP